LASITAFPSKKDGDYPTQIFKTCVLRRALTGNSQSPTTFVPEVGLGGKSSQVWFNLRRYNIHEVYAPEAKRTIHYIVANHRDVLLFLANYATITLHPWSSRLQTLEYPDFVLFDLDPIVAPFEVVVKVALELKSVLEELKLKAYLKTSGVSGLHLYMPVHGVTYGDARVFAEAMASIIVQRAPNLATLERSVSKRGKGQVYVDCLQNGRGKTLASVYSVRSRPQAPVATPLDWSELKKAVDPTCLNIETIVERIKTVGDLFKPVLHEKQDIAPLLSALRAHR
jgi:bifunctional non-homologous end joining protein LigD